MSVSTKVVAAAVMSAVLLLLSTMTSSPTASAQEPPLEFTQISAGKRHTCAVQTNGSPFCWGSNSNDEPNKPDPWGWYNQATPPDGISVTQVSAGELHTCAVQTNGVPICWGGSVFGETTPPSEIVVTEVSAGGFHSCAVQTDGSPVCWGDDYYRQRNPPDGLTVTDISAGYRHSCAVQLNGSPICWGDNEYGQANPPDGLAVTDISAGYRHSCAVQLNGSPICWGDNEYGQANPPDGLAVTDISAGLRHSCAVQSNGSPICWGDNEYGQATPPDGPTVTQISAGKWHTCAIRTNGTALCWGQDADAKLGQPSARNDTFSGRVGYPAFFNICSNDRLGLGTTAATLVSESFGPGLLLLSGCFIGGTPTATGEFVSRYRLTDANGGSDEATVTITIRPAPSDQPTLASVEAGDDHTCAIEANGTPTCWGSNSIGRSVPPAGLTVTQISAGGSHSCAVQSDRTPICWGSSLSGQSTPPDGLTVTQISAGHGHTCALKTDGTPVCWGRNARYDGTYTGQATPPNGLTVTQISAGREHTCTVQANGAPICWGDNDYGQATPPAGLTVTDISAGDRHSCAVQANSAPICWGDNEYGQANPPDGITATQITAGSRYTCALKTDRTPVCWGDIRFAQTGALAGLTVTQITAGSRHTCALKTDSTPVCWGDNYYGQLGPEFLPTAADDAFVAEQFSSVRLNICANDTIGNQYSLITRVSGGYGPGLSRPGEVANGCIISGTPTQVGRYTYRYRITDATSNTDEATVTITIVAPDSIRPVAADDSIVGVRDVPLSLDICANDTAGSGYSLIRRVSGGYGPGLARPGDVANGCIISGTPTQVGRYTYRYRITDRDGDTDEATVTITIVAPGSPAIEPPTVPGVIEAEDYDVGGFSDADPGNTTGVYRNDDVDIFALKENNIVVDDQFVIGRTRDGEWLEYSVNIDTAGSFDLALRYASDHDGTTNPDQPNEPGSITVTIDGVEINTHNINRTGGWWAWNEPTIARTTMTAGTHTIRLTITDGYYNIDRLTITDADDNPSPFACSANAGTLTWTDHNQTKYWTYKKAPNTDTFTWLGKTLGPTTIVDPNPAPGTQYQVHYQGIPRTTCTSE